MFTIVSKFLTIVLLTSKVVAQDVRKYTVWSSVIFSRTGERTPAILGDIPTQLTSVGAHQQLNAGAFFRERYVESFGSENGVEGAPIAGLNVYIPDLKQLSIIALDMQSTLASAEAFMQGFYPPYQETDNNTEVLKATDPIGFVANGTYIPAPMNGYQYTQIHALGAYDPEYVYIGGNIECPAFDTENIDYILTPEFAETQAASKSIYETIGPVFLSEWMPPEQWGYINAYAIYDYLNYWNAHDVGVNSLLSDPKSIDPGTDINYLDTLRWYADQQQYAQLGNLHATNNVTSEPFPDGITGSISTLSGNLLAAKMLAQLQQSVFYQGEFYKLSLLFGDFQPLISLFALTGLPSLDSHFYGLPEFASVAVFELFTESDGLTDGSVYPSEDELWVRFYFRNGTDSEEPYQSYPLFNNGPASTDMKWTDFQTSMSQILIGDVGIWCQQCGTWLSEYDRVFCAYFNASESVDAQTSSGSHGHLSPTIGGVIGAIVALVIAGLFFGAIMLIGGLRFHRVKSRKSELGGFKGGQKMASDKDLTLPKGGAIVGASVETPGSPVSGGHERVGSWELNKQHDLPNIAATHPARRPSFEEDDDIGDIGAAPYRAPTLPDERV